MKTALNKISIALLTIFIIISLSFLLIRIMPGNTLLNIVGQEEYYYLLDHNPEELNRISMKYGLNESLGVQYVRYLKNIITLDFGRAYSNHQPVIDNVIEASKNTLLLAIPTWLIGGLLGGILGLFSGWKPGSRFDKITTPVFIFFNTLPSNCLAILLLIIFSYNLKIFPINNMVSPGVEGMDRVLNILWHMTLPLIILIIGRTSSNFMLMKSSVSQIRKDDYLLTAQSKGLTDRGVLYKHLLINAALPYGTYLCIQLGYILSGSMIIEVIFNWKGMGTLMYKAVTARDFPTAQLCFLISAILVVTANLISNLLNIILDPRIKSESS
ncbi:MAG: peptide ABC transporter permease [Clostridiales bacterium]|nr:MAG: peptide ABC transporter permease [Clostridiales bacterium]